MWCDITVRPYLADGGQQQFIDRFHKLQDRTWPDCPQSPGAVPEASAAHWVLLRDGPH